MRGRNSVSFLFPSLIEEILKETLCFILKGYVIQEWKQEVTQSVPILRNSEKNEGVPIPLKQSDYDKIRCLTFLTETDDVC